MLWRNKLACLPQENVFTIGLSFLKTPKALVLHPGKLQSYSPRLDNCEKMFWTLKRTSLFMPELNIFRKKSFIQPALKRLEVGGWSTYHALLFIKLSMSRKCIDILLKIDSPIGRTHRDKTRVQMPAKKFPHLELLCMLSMGPTLGFDTKQRNSFLWNLVFFYNKSKILTILFIVKYEKITLKWWVFSVVGAHNQEVFCMFKWGKNKQKQQRVLALVLSLWAYCMSCCECQFC